jgi:hypothetical protein
LCHPSSQDKVVEDKTFGLKNKSKSKKVQQYVPSLVAAMVPSLRLAACLQCFLFVCLPAIDPGLAHRSKPPPPPPLSQVRPAGAEKCEGYGHGGGGEGQGR